MAKKPTATRSKATSKKTAQAAAGRGSKTLSAQMGELANAWGDAEAQTGGFNPLPDGDYQFRIESAKIESSKTSQRLQINWGLQVVTPEEHVGKTHHKYDGLNTEDSLAWTKGNLETLGQEIPDDVDDLPATLANCVGVIVSTTILTKNDMQNTYFNEVVEEMAEDADADVEGTGDEAPEEGAEEEVEIEEGASVEVDFDGTAYPGTITEIGDDACTVTFDDGEVVEVKNEDLVILAEE